MKHSSVHFLTSFRGLAIKNHLLSCRSARQTWRCTTTRSTTWCRSSAGWSTPIRRGCRRSSVSSGSPGRLARTRDCRFLWPFMIIQGVPLYFPRGHVWESQSRPQFFLDLTKCWGSNLALCHFFPNLKNGGSVITGHPVLCTYILSFLWSSSSLWYNLWSYICHRLRFYVGRYQDHWLRFFWIMA